MITLKKIKRDARLYFFEIVWGVWVVIVGIATYYTKDWEQLQWIAFSLMWFLLALGYRDKYWDTLDELGATTQRLVELEPNAVIEVNSKQK